MPDYSKLFVLYTEAIYTVPVGTDADINEDYIERAAIVKHAFLNQLNRKSLRYNWHDAEVSRAGGCICQR